MQSFIIWAVVMSALAKQQNGEQGVDTVVLGVICSGHLSTFLPGHVKCQGLKDV
jgi:hypothetical protein